jgi:eukaryotic-like serine/threonine-protein kinase
MIERDWGSARSEAEEGITVPSEAAPSSAAGSTIGRYRLATKLGTGGTANVFLAVMQAPRQLRKLAVLKVPHDDIALDASLRLMFLDEARLAARLNHPNVVRTYEVFDEDERTILVMEYVDGFSLAQILTAGRRAGRPLSLPLHLRILSEVLMGLHYAHELRDGEGKPLELVHRDISPQNILVTMDGQVKIVDFGIAKAANASHVTARGSFKGKIRYMPPEQLRGRAVDRRADVFAVGAVLWDAAIGRPLWDRTPDINVMGALMGGNIPCARQRKPDLDPALATILDRALAFDMSDRHPTALAFHAELEAYLGATPAERSRQTREIGAFMSSVFAEAHASRMRAVADTLGPGEFLTPSSEPPTSMGGVTVTPSRSPGPGASLSPSSVSSPAPRLRPQRPWSRIPGRWVAVGAGAALCLFFAVALVRDVVRPQRAASAAAIASPSQIGPPAIGAALPPPLPTTSTVVATPSASVPAPLPRPPTRRRGPLSLVPPSHPGSVTDAGIGIASSAPLPSLPAVTAPPPLRTSIESRK